MSLDGNPSHASISSCNGRGIKFEWLKGITLIMSDCNYNCCWLLWPISMCPGSIGHVTVSGDKILVSRSFPALGTEVRILLAQKSQKGYIYWILEKQWVKQSLLTFILDQGYAHNWGAVQLIKINWAYWAHPPGANAGCCAKQYSRPACILLTKRRNRNIQCLNLYW